MIYWRIRQPGKSWRDWSNGVSEDVLEAQVDSMASVLDENHQLLPWAVGGIDVDMYECEQIDDFKITQANAKTFRENYLGIVEEVAS